MTEECHHCLKVEKVLEKSRKGIARILYCKHCKSKFLELDGLVHEITGRISENQIDSLMTYGFDLKVKQ